MKSRQGSDETSLLGDRVGSWFVLYFLFSVVLARAVKGRSWLWQQCWLIQDEAIEIHEEFSGLKIQINPKYGAHSVKASYTPQTPHNTSNRLYGGLGCQFLFENALGSRPMHHFLIRRFSENGGKHYHFVLLLCLHR